MMQQSKKVRYIIVLFLLGVSVVALVGWNICVGTVRIPLADIFASIRGEKIENSRILWDIRMPRTLAAMILGGALALAGYLLQTFFHNPIAGPFVLGISSGAKMVVALVMVFLMGQAVKITSWALIAAAFVGALTAGLLATMIKNQVGYPRISVTVPSIVIMVPGLYLYRGFYNLGTMNLSVSASWFAAAILIVAALPLGLIFARILTDKTFRYCT